MKIAPAIVILSMPPIPQIPTIRKFGDWMHNSDFILSMRELSPTIPSKSLEGDMQFKLLKISLISSSMSFASGLAGVKINNSESKT